MNRPSKADRSILNLAMPGKTRPVFTIEQIASHVLHPVQASSLRTRVILRLVIRLVNSNDAISVIIILPLHISNGFAASSYLPKVLIT
jgi:hypothetical protein